MTGQQRPPGLRLGSIRGAQIVVQPSTLLMLVILAFLYSSSADGRITAHAFSLGMLLAVLLFVSVFIHELAHAVAAWGFGRKVTTIMLTLWGGVTSFDARNLGPAVMGVTAVAGPAANGVVALAAWGVLQTGVVEGLPADVVRWLVWTNVVLGVFNVLPGIPMDGGKVLQAIVWKATGDPLRAQVVAGWAGRVVAVGVVALAVAYPLAQGGQLSIVNVVFAVLIFSVIWPAASAAVHAAGVMERRQGASIAALMRPAVGVPYTLTVQAAREAASAGGADAVVVLAADGAPAGVAAVDVMDRVPAQHRHTAGLQSVTTPLPRGAVVAPMLGGDELISRLREWYGRADSWAVVDGERVVGVVRLETVLAALQ